LLNPLLDRFEEKRKWPRRRIRLSLDSERKLKTEERDGEDECDVRKWSERRLLFELLLVLLLLLMLLPLRKLKRSVML
jgi:hypothetical protein